MSTRVEVRVWVDVRGDVDTGELPQSMKWEHEERLTGDNPRYLADAIQSAIMNATSKAVSNIEKHVDLRATV